MFYKQKNQVQRWWFNRSIRGILKTAPLRLDEHGRGPAVLSQLQHKDVLMYLAAVKSFAFQLPPAEVHVVDDGSLTKDDRALLSDHIPGLHFHALVESQVAGLPRGGTWERLIAIARLSETRYVIQLDADTLTLAAIPDVKAAARSNTGFTIGTWDHQQVEPMLERASEAQKHLAGDHPHVQVLAEANFSGIQGAASLRYVRGCSGFAGFSPGGGKLELIRELSGQMQALIGDRWLEWGSEQVMSNLVVANQPDAIVLPHPDFADCMKMRSGKTRFVHFIGTCRFKGGHYARMIRNLDWAGPRSC